MRAAVLTGIGHLTLQERPLPEIGDDEALIRVSYVGVCGSDMALFENGYIGESTVREPMVLGHEASGVVVQVGDGVTALRPGMRVALEPGVPCLACDFCREGRYNLCPDVYFWASLPVTEGALQEYVRHRASFCHPLPDDVDLLEGAMIEPLSVRRDQIIGARQAGGNRPETVAIVSCLPTHRLPSARAQVVHIADQFGPHRNSSFRSCRRRWRAHVRGIVDQRRVQIGRAHV